MRCLDANQTSATPQSVYAAVAEYSKADNTMLIQFTAVCFDSTPDGRFDASMAKTLPLARRHVASGDGQQRDQRRCQQEERVP